MTRPYDVSFSTYIQSSQVQRAYEVVQGYWRFTIAAVGISSLCWFGVHASGRNGMSSLLDVLQSAGDSVMAKPVHSMVVVAAGLILVPVHISRSKEWYLLCWSSKWLVFLAPDKQTSTVVCASVSAFQSHRIQLDAECQSPTCVMEPFLRWFAGQSQQQQHCHPSALSPSPAEMSHPRMQPDSSSLGSHRVELSPRAYDGDASHVRQLRKSFVLSKAPSIRTWLKFLQFQDAKEPASPRCSSPLATQVASSSVAALTTADMNPTSSSVAPDINQIVGENLLQQFRDLVDPMSSEQLSLPATSSAWADATSLFGLPDNKHRAAAWECVVQQATPAFALTSCRKPLRNGLFLYCSRAVFHNASPEQVRAFYMDDQYKVSCDKSLLEWVTLPNCQTSTDMSQAPPVGSETCFLFSRIDFPGPLAAREYTYARQVWDREDGGCFCINKSCSHAAAPKSKGRVVDDYSSGFVIRSCASAAGSPPSTELVIIYFEDSRVRAPGLLNLAISKGLWGSWQRLEGWFRDHARVRAQQRAASQIVPYPLTLEDLEGGEVEPFPLLLNEGSDGEDDEQPIAARQAEGFLRQYQIQLRPLRILPSALFSSSSASPAPNSKSSLPLSDRTTHTCDSSDDNTAGPSHTPSPSDDMPRRPFADTPSSVIQFNRHNDADDSNSVYCDAASDWEVDSSFVEHADGDVVYGDDSSMGSYPLGVRAPIPAEWLPLLAAGGRWRHAGASSVGGLKKTFVKVFTVLRGDRYKRRRRWASLRRQVVKVAKFAAGVKIMEAVLTVKGSLDTA